jgi:tetratricopeptide (TPR) repeat protein
MNRQALMLVAALFSMVPRAPGQAPAGLSLSLPGLDWSLALGAPGFTVQARNALPDDRGLRLLAAGSGMTVSLQLEKQPDLSTAQACRDHHLRDLQQMGLAWSELKWSENPTWATTEFLITPIRQKNVFVYGMRDGVCTMVHLSKVEFRLTDQKRMSDVLQTVRFVEGSPQSAPAAGEEASEVFKRGAALYRGGDYAGAIPHLKAALDSEKRTRTLDKIWWRVLVDSLGMSYGITGRLKEAIETLQYGVSRDPSYGMFYYNLACAYAEMSDLDDAIANLKMASRYRNNLNPSETMPDPWSDPSFRRFLKNARFAQAAQDFGK